MTRASARRPLRAALCLSAAFAAAYAAWPYGPIFAAIDAMLMMCPRLRCSIDGRAARIIVTAAK